jgi:hypothetical protein
MDGRISFQFDLHGYFPFLWWWHAKFEMNEMQEPSSM